MVDRDGILVKSKSGMKICASNGNDVSLFPFVLAEPVWVKDEEVTCCMKCSKKFSMVERRHHCRRCGFCLCGGCCSSRLPLLRMSFIDPVRVCSSCAPITNLECEFFTKDVPQLQQGAMYAEASLSEVDAQSRAKYKRLHALYARLSDDRRSLICASSSWSASIRLEKISDVFPLQMRASDEPITDKEVHSITSSHFQRIQNKNEIVSVCGVDLRFVDSHEARLSLQLFSDPNECDPINFARARLFITLFIRAMDMVRESREKYVPL